MKIKKVLFFLVLALMLFLVVGCDGGEVGIDPVDPLVPTAITLKVKVAKVQINNSLKITYAITPATAQGNDVTIELNNQLATYTKEGNNSIILQAGDKEGTVKVTVKTTNGITATKTIKIQLEAVESYPDLNGYKIKIAQAGHALGEYDVNLTRETADQYGYYGGADREYRIQAWKEIEDNYNCILAVEAYPSDAPWGHARWQYILTQAQSDSPEFDFYVTPNAQIPGYVAGNAVLDLTDWYAQYGKNIMSDMDKTAGSYKQRLYAINYQNVDIKMVLSYNVGLLEKIQEKDPTIEEPAKLFLEGKWDYNDFYEYCVKVQTALDTNFSTEGEKYYCLSGYGVYYWQGMVNAAGVRVLDTTQLKASVTGDVEAAAAKTMQDIYTADCMDPAFQVDQGVTSWNNQHALFNAASFWFVNAANRWSADLWGEGETRYGYVPFPKLPGMTGEGNYVGVTTDACLAMAAGREWAYKGFGDECTSENIYRAYMDYLNSSKNYYINSEDYNRVDDLTAFATGKFGSEASVQAYLRVILGKQLEDGTYEGGIETYGFYDPFVGDNPVVSAWGGNTSFAGAVTSYIKASDASAQWIDAVGSWQATIEKSLVDAYG